MNSEKLSKIEEIYHAALEIEINERLRFLSKICGDDRELRREVESLLPFAEVSSSLIDQPPMDVAAEMVAETANSAFIGTKIKHYNIVSNIGIGGMGEVFLALDTKLERNVAIKFIKTEFIEDKDKLRRFRQEAKTASSLNHPNILTVYEIGNSKNRQFIAAEFIEGKTLRKVLNEESLSLTKILEITIQIATALKAAHSAGIIHRDIKPENIMLRSDGLVKVLDFGLAKLVKLETPPVLSGLNPEKRQSANGDPHLTNPGMVMGTVAYISPEQARFEPIDARSDLWSLSIVLYEMLTGHQPFKGNSASETIDSILNDEPAAIGDNIPNELKQILKKALQKNAEERYQNAGDLLRDLKNCQNDFAGESQFKPDLPTSDDNDKTSSNETRVSNPVHLNSGDFSNIRSNNLSSAEFVFKKVGQNKVFSIGFLAIILIVLIGYFNFSADSQPTASIAVMPFANTSGDPNLEYLSEGISESLINSLSQLNNVKVIAHNSSIKYKGKEEEFEKAARDLGVRFILSGQISQNGDNLQVKAELVDILDKTRIWNEQFNRKSGEVAMVEAEISRQIAERLKLHLTKTGQEQIVKKTKSNPQAYELLLKGRFFQSKSSFESSKKAVEYYNQALAVDPNYAQAYAALASTYFYIGANGFQDPKEVLAKARAAAERAMELDDNLPEAIIAMAGIKLADRDWAGAEREYKRAIELNPNLAAAHFRYAFYLSLMGQHEKAISEIKQARELDPLKPLINIDIAYILYFARQYDPALEQFEIGLELDPNYGSTYYGKGFVNAARGQFVEAVANYREMIRLEGDHTGVDCYLGFALAKSGQQGEARAILEKLETGKKYVSPVELAVLYLGLGEQEKALATLERAFAENDSQLQFLGIEPHFDQLRTNPRFAELIRRVGLLQ